MTVSRKTLSVIRNLRRSDSMSHHVVQIEKNQTVLQVLNANNISIPQQCGGNGTCLTCRFVALSDESHFANVSDVENEILNERGFKSFEKLSCQTVILKDSEIEITIDDED